MNFVQICGVWRKVPRVYKQLLREEKLWVALMEDKDGEAITGRVARYKALSTELLSAVLTPSGSGSSANCPACGGTAAVSMASASNSIHVTVAVSGLSSRGADVETFVVRLETLETGAHPSRVIEELVTVQKPQEVREKHKKSFSRLFSVRPSVRSSVRLVELDKFQYRMTSFWFFSLCNPAMTHTARKEQGKHSSPSLFCPARTQDGWTLSHHQRGLINLSTQRLFFFSFSAGPFFLFPLGGRFSRRDFELTGLNQKNKNLFCIYPFKKSF
jgi:hypothetical protein